jgi:hypothetical protein
MSQPIRTATAVVFALLAAMAAPAFADPEIPRVVIRLYDISGGTEEARASAMHTTAAILRDAGIDVDWRDCSADGANHPCRTVREAHELAIRIMPRYVPAARVTASSVAARLQGTDETLPLGFAALDAHTRSGVSATIFHDRVQAVAHRSHLDLGLLLGRAIAHEVGHLILHAPGHAAEGLMRAEWTDEELLANRPGDWVFAEPEQRRLQMLGALERAGLEREAAVLAALPVGPVAVLAQLVDGAD